MKDIPWNCTADLGFFSYIKEKYCFFCCLTTIEYLDCKFYAGARFPRNRVAFT